MTGSQIIQAIKLALDKYSTSTSAVIGPAFLDEELCAFANQAMLEIICTKFTGNNQLKQGFEQSVKRVSDLEKLVTPAEYTLELDQLNRYVTKAGAIKDDCLFLVGAAVKVIHANVSYSVYPAEYVDRKTAEKFLKTPINYPWIPVPKVTSFQVKAEDGHLTRGLAVYVDPDLTALYDPSFKLNVEWVVQPNTVTVDNLDDPAFDGVFSDAVLYEIVNRAALLILDNIESQRIQNKAELNKFQE